MVGQLTAIRTSTVDLISYTVQSLTPTTLIEAAQGSGGLCGGSFLNRAFEAYLDRKFQDFPAFDRGYKTSVMQFFENNIKRSFAGLDVRPEEPYRVAVRGLNTDNGQRRRHILERLGIKNERLEIPKRDLQPIFDEVVEEVIALVQAQILSTHKKVRSVLLAGGFGESPFLRKKLETQMRNQTRVIPINNGYVFAVDPSWLFRGRATNT